MKKEEVDEDQEEEEEEEEEEEATRDPVIAPPTEVSIEVQTDPVEGSVKLEAPHRERYQLLLQALHR